MVPILTICPIEGKKDFASMRACVSDGPSTCLNGPLVEGFGGAATFPSPILVMSIGDIPSPHDKFN